MPPSNVCWGVEIGAGAIKALKLEADGDELNVLDFAVINHAKVLSTPELDQDDAIRVALGQLTNQVDLSGALLAISVPGHQSFARFAKLPPVEPKKVPDIVKFEAVQQIPFPLEDVEWDYQTFASPDSPDIEVGIFAITRQRIMDRLAMLADVGLTPDVATISPVAAYNALAVDLGFTESTPGTIILDIGAHATDMIVADAGRVWIRTFQVGGHNFTEALVNTFKLSYGKAEKLKREAEQTKHARHVFQAMRPVFGDLVQEVQRSIGFYKSVHPDANLQRLIGLGSTFRLPGLRKYLKQQVQLDVYRMEQFKKLGVDGPRAGEFQAATLNLCTAYGLALQGLDRAALRANLMPVRVLREAMWKRKVPWFAAAAGVAAAASGAMFIRPLMDSSAFNSAEPPRVLTEVSRDAQRLRAEAEAAGVTGSAAPDLRASRIVALLEGREVYPHILNDTGAMLATAPAAARGAADPLEIVSLQTSFVPAEGGGEVAYAPEDEWGGVGDTDYGGGGRTAMSGGPAAPASGGVEAAVPRDVSQRLAGKAYIRVEAVLRTPLAGAQLERFMNESVDQWLRDNGSRPGVPYQIVVPANRNAWELSPAAVAPGRQVPRGSGSAADVDRVAPLTRPAAGAAAPTTCTLTWYAMLGEPAPAGGES